MIDRKEQILDVTTELLLSRSFNSFSYKDLSDRLGISKASIHHHFSTKDELGVAVSERLRSTYIQRLKEITQKCKSPWDAFEAYLALVGGFVQSGNKICPPGCVQAEYNVVPEGMQRATSELYHFIHNWLTRVLADGREQGAMSFPGDPKDEAALIHAAIQGAIQNSRAEGPKEFTSVVRQLKASLKEKS